MFAVHSVAQRMPKDEYGVFTTMLQIITLMGVPAMGLQSVFAQQAAAALTAGQERTLASTFRAILRAGFYLWLLIVLAVWIFRNEIMTALKIANPAALWLTVIIGLLSLWRPMVLGMLQGRQNFSQLGGLLMSEGAGRFAVVMLTVGLLAHFAAGALVAVLAGMVAMVGMGLWCNRSYFRGESTPMDWSEWLRRGTPLTLGMGAEHPPDAAYSTQFG